jgi:arylsulfatase A-like enzyme
MSMTSGSGEVGEDSSSGSSPSDLASNRWGLLSFLMVSAWCGLVSGLLEVGIIVLRKRTYDFNHLYWMSRHFIWLIPLINLALFLVLGLALSIVVWCSGRQGRSFGARALCTLTLLPAVWVALPRIYGAAGFLLAVGIASRLVPVLERRQAGLSRLVRLSFPVVAAVAPILAAYLLGTDQLKVRSEHARALPPAGSPNVLLIVLDTVAADHLSLHGYGRRTSPTIDSLAERGIRFDRARSTSSWTLVSHSSIFTGRWPHELSAGWFTPMGGEHPTVAEFLASHGYATAGFIGNYWYCGSDSGLDRGFATYRDYIFPRLTAIKSTVLVDRTIDGLQAVEQSLEDWLNFDLFSSAANQIGRLFKTNRKEASVVSREFLDWLSRRRQPERPFFAFLNFYDAHYPYELPPTGMHRFGAKPRSARERTLMRDWPMLMQKNPSESQIRFGRDSYDNCVADLDEQLGRLIDELDRRSILGSTWVIITADHGESFGEKHGVFWHGTSLYQSQLHVPLVLIPPASSVSPRVVFETVSLRDLPATIVDLVGIKGDVTFPGSSLACFWNGSGPAAPGSPLAATTNAALSEVVPLDSFGTDPSQWLIKKRWPLAAVTQGDWTYIRREGDVREELFHLRDDSHEQENLVTDPAMQRTLEQMREALRRLTAGPLTPERFNP